VCDTFKSTPTAFRKLITIALHLKEIVPMTGRYSRLAPLTINQRIQLSVAALRFFGPTNYQEMCAAIDRVPVEGRIEPFVARDFLSYLNFIKLLDDPDRYTYRLKELLMQLEHAGLLMEVGRSNDILLGTSYYSMKELTAREREGLAWLAIALGPELIYSLYSTATVQITGINARGDINAGTALVVAPNWLLTCAHVLNDMVVDDTQIVCGQRVNVLRQIAHATMDVGLIEVASPIPMLTGLSFRDPIVSEPVFTLGYPRVPLSREASLVMQRGEVTSCEVTLLDGRQVFLYSAIARPGNSGGPILSQTGHILGIVTEELAEEAAGFRMPFHAGIRTSEIVRALTELDAPFLLPVEDYE
jgi:hypothetical protein